MAELFELRRELGREMLRKRRIYLDIKFWNTFCDVEIENGGTAVDREAFVALRQGVASGTLVCPIEYYVLSELLKQRRCDKRIATATLIDELSGSATIISAGDRVMLELLRFFQACKRGDLKGSAPVDEVWTKPAFVLGHNTPSISGVSEEIQAWVTGRANEALWDVTFCDVVESLSDDSPHNADREEVIRELNIGKRDPVNQRRRLSEVY